MAQPKTLQNQSNKFSLFRIHTDCHYMFVKADFTSPPNVNSQVNSILPTYMSDRNFFTPAFVVFRDKEYYQSNLRFECSKFEEKILKAEKLCQDLPGAEDEPIQICPPFPSNKYCQICKRGYDSYEDHLRQTAHLRQARFSKANTYISQLCRKYSKNSSKTAPKRKNLQIQKTPKQTSCKYESIKSQRNKTGSQSLHLGKFMNYSTNVQSLEAVLQQ